jgi:uncharacterized protein (TIGR01777 family)
MARKMPAERVNFVKCDMLADAILPEMIAGQEVIVHLAGVPVFTRWNTAYKMLIWRSRIETAQKLVDSILALPAAERPKVVISASAVGYYGERRDDELTENSGPGNGFLPEVCEAWERVWEPLSAAGIRIVTIRTGVVVGAGGGIMGALLPFYKLGLGPIVGNGQAYLSWIAMEDLIRIYLFAIENAQVSGPVNAVSPNPVTYKSFAKTIGTSVRRPVFLYSPLWVMDIGLNGAAKEGFASAKVSPEKLLQTGFTFNIPEVSQAIEKAL